MITTRATVKGIITTTAIAALALGLGACTPAPATPSGPQSTPAASSEPATPSSSEAAPPQSESTSPSESATAEESAGTEAAVAISPAAGGLPGAAECYNDKGDNLVPTPEQGKIEKGAVRAWLCGDAPGGYGTIGPMEPLVSGIDQIVDAFYALPSGGVQHAQDAGDVYRVVFEYADGTRKVLEAEVIDGGPATDGTIELSGGAELISSVRGQWIDQRVALGPDAAPAAEQVADIVATCPAPEHFVMPSPITDVAGGWVCSGNSEDGVLKQKLDPQLAKKIAAALEDNSESITGESDVSDSSVSLMTPWGESITLKNLSDGEGYLWIGDQGAMRFTPPSGLLEEMADALSRKQ